MFLLVEEYIFLINLYTLSIKLSIKTIFKGSIQNKQLKFGYGFRDFHMISIRVFQSMQYISGKKLFIFHM